MTSDPAPYDEPASGYTDAQMLDWLDARNRALNEHYGTIYGWRVVLSPNVTRVMTDRRPADGGYVADVDVHDSMTHGQSSIRAAIAEAMRVAGVDPRGVATIRVSVKEAGNG